MKIGIALRVASAFKKIFNKNDISGRNKDISGGNTLEEKNSGNIAL